jgi:hypothetical protein
MIVGGLKALDWTAMVANGTSLHSMRRKSLIAIGCIADKQGQLALHASAAVDPTATLALHCGNGFDARFSPYQSTRLSRYNAVS